MGTIDIKNFSVRVVSDDNTFLMKDAKEGLSSGSMAVQKMRDIIITPLIEVLFLNYRILTRAEFDAQDLERSVLYIIRENWKLVRTYIGALLLTAGKTLFRALKVNWQLTA